MILSVCAVRCIVDASSLHCVKEGRVFSSSMSSQASRTHPMFFVSSVSKSPNTKALLPSRASPTPPTDKVKRSDSATRSLSRPPVYVQSSTNHTVSSFSVVFIVLVAFSFLFFFFCQDVFADDDEAQTGKDVKYDYEQDELGICKPVFLALSRSPPLLYFGVI